MTTAPPLRRALAAACLLAVLVVGGCSRGDDKADGDSKTAATDNPLDDTQCIDRLVALSKDAEVVAAARNGTGSRPQAVDRFVADCQLGFEGMTQAQLDQAFSHVDQKVQAYLGTAIQQAVTDQSSKS